MVSEFENANASACSRK